MGLGAPTKRAGLSGYEPRRCQYEFSWDTEYACPACTDEDFIEVWGLCANNAQTSNWVNTHACSGGFVPPAGRSQPCTPPTREDMPPVGHAYVIVDVRLQNVTPQKAVDYPNVVAAALSAHGVFRSQVAVIAVSGTLLAFRIDRPDNTTALAVADAVKIKFDNVNSDLGGAETVTIKYYTAPEPVVIRGKHAAVPPAGVAAIVIVILVLAAALAFFVFKNRRLKYDNYRLIRAGGAGGAIAAIDSDLYDDGAAPAAAPKSGMCGFAVLFLFWGLTSHFAAL